VTDSRLQGKAKFKTRMIPGIVWVRLCISQTHQLGRPANLASGFVFALWCIAGPHLFLYFGPPQIRNINIGGHDLASFGIFRCHANPRVALFLQFANSGWLRFDAAFDHASHFLIISGIA
jgi:hypothetical protein